jgi:Protein of unknown function (DUF3102)
MTAEMHAFPDHREMAAREINALHAQHERAHRTTLEAAVRIGELLTLVKTELKHGEWLPWIKANCTFEKSTANNYVRAYMASKLPSSGNLPEPKEIAEAAARAPSQRKRRGGASVGWLQAVTKYLPRVTWPYGISWKNFSRKGELRDALEKRLTFPIPKRLRADDPRAKEVADAMTAEFYARYPEQPKRIFEDARAGIDADDRADFDHRLNDALQAARADFKRRAAEEVATRIKDHEEWFAKETERLAAERELLTADRKRLQRGVLTRDEYRFVLTCVHPDQPDRTPERLNRAFQIIKTLERFVPEA